MTILDLPPVIQETLAVHEAFRRLGFGADAIFVALTTDGRVAVILRDQNLEFTTTSETNTLSSELFVSLWIQACQLWNEAPDNQLAAIWDHSAVKRRGLDLVHSLLYKGFVLPISQVKPSAPHSDEPHA